MAPQTEAALLRLVLEFRNLALCQSSISLPSMYCFAHSTAAASSGQSIALWELPSAAKMLTRYSVAEPSTRWALNHSVFLKSRRNESAICLRRFRSAPLRAALTEQTAASGGGVQEVPRQCSPYGRHAAKVDLMTCDVSLDQAGARHSQSPIVASNCSAMRKRKPNTVRMHEICMIPDRLISTIAY